MSHSRIGKCLESSALHVDLSPASADSSNLIDKSEITVDKKIGFGSSSTVFEGRWKNQIVAIKKMEPSKKYSEPFAAFSKRVENEATIMAKLMQAQAPNMVPFYGKMMDSSSYSLVTKYIPNMLLDMLQKNDLPDWGQRYQIIKQTLTFVDFAHKKNILHRDLKTDNVLIDDNKNAHVCDFGYAVETDSDGKYNVSSFAGTLGWVSPEIIQSYSYSVKSDSFAVGTFLWEIATSGLVPFALDSDENIVLWTQQGKHEEIPSNCPAVVKSIINDCWLFAPERRPSAETMLQILEKDPTVAAAIASIHPHK
jgi:serine/threonine protein kinase